jgi:preprotein translocase subunit SecD
MYQMTIQSSITSAQIAGGIIAGISGLGALMTGMLLYKENEKV